MSEPNWADKTIWTGDNLPIMRGMNSESVDLIYLDPPFNSKANYAAPIGSKAAGAEFKDTWTLQDVDVAWLDLIETKYPKLHRVILAAMSKSDQSYLVYMAVRLLETKRLLKPTGSIYLHCDPTMSHYLKLIMDAVFKRKNFRNEIAWCYKWGGSNTKKNFKKKHDVIFRYTATDTYTFNLGDVLIYGDKSGWSDETRGRIPNDWWSDIPSINTQAKERTGYPTQKPLDLLERIIKASSNRNDVVFDPFCGCATTMVAADRLQRQWIGIDISSKAVELVVRRIKDDQGTLEAQDRLHGAIIPRTDIPKRTDLGALPKYNCAANKRNLYGAQAGNCAGCGMHFEMRNLEVDHIIAKISGGTDHIDNLQLLCSSCNRIKGNRGQEYLLAQLNQQGWQWVRKRSKKSWKSQSS